MKYAPLDVGAGQRARRHEVLVFVGVAEELGDLGQVLVVEDATSVGHVVVVPGELGHDPVVHADVEVGEHEDRRLEPLGQVEALHGELEALVRVGREEHDVLGVAVRGVGAHQDVALLGARGHARRGPTRWTSMMTAGISV